MCSIAGLYSPTGTPNPEHVDAMRAALLHRGPDEGSTDSFGHCVFGHQRLKVIDLDTGYQPVANETGEVVAVYNGEAYNFQALREELRAHEVRGTGDTPMLPISTKRAGHASWNGSTGCSRSRSGTRARTARARTGPARQEAAALDAAPGRQLLRLRAEGAAAAAQVSREVDLEAIDAFLALQYVPGDRTALRGIHKLPPGHVLVANGGTERIERYWQAEAAEPSANEDEWLERVRATVGAAVRKRLVADVPLGALLSGGIDSSIVVALMAEAASQPVRTFTVGFADDRYDERTYARAVASRFGTVHEELQIEEDVAATLPRLAATYGEPLGDEAAFPTFLIAEQARRHVTVALAGDGGDESFAGYERYVATGLPAGFQLPSRRVAPRRCAYCPPPGVNRGRRCSGPRAFSTSPPRPPRSVTHA